jgi:hypothetical protein
MIPSATRAIEIATGCPVDPSSIDADIKTVAVTIDCSRATAPFLRALPVVPSSSARAGTGAYAGDTPPQTGL